MAGYAVGSRAFVTERIKLPNGRIAEFCEWQGSSKIQTYWDE